MLSMSMFIGPACGVLFIDVQLLASLMSMLTRSVALVFMEVLFSYVGVVRWSCILCIVCNMFG